MSRKELPCFILSNHKDCFLNNTVRRRANQFLFVILTIQNKEFIFMLLSNKKGHGANKMIGAENRCNSDLFKIQNCSNFQMLSFHD